MNATGFVATSDSAVLSGARAVAICVPTPLDSDGIPDLGAAEMAKLLKNTYRSVNIALVNELSQICHQLDIDLWDVIDCAATKPFGFQSFRPGVWVGGHCILVDRCI